MLRSIAPAINLKNSRKKSTLQIFFALFTRPVSPSSIYVTLLLPVMALTTTAKRKHYLQFHSRVFAFIRVELRAAADCLHACVKCDLAKSRFHFARRKRAKNYLSTKLISQKLIRWPHIIFYKGLFITHRRRNREKKKNVRCGIFSILKFPFFFYIIGKSTPQNFSV